MPCPRHTGMLAASGASNCASCRQIDLLQGINDEQRYQSAYAAQLAECDIPLGGKSDDGMLIVRVRL